jgi:hypothetical protein
MDRGRRGGRRGRAGHLRAIAFGVPLLFVVLLLLVSPYSVAATSGVKEKNPYSGVVFTDGYGSFSGIGCGGTGNYSYIPPYFSLHTGRGGVGQLANSNPCVAGVDEYHQYDTDFGLNSSPFHPSKKVVNDKVEFHWTLTYILLVNTTWGGGNQVAYAYASIAVGAWVDDLTTGVGTGSQTAFDNFTYLYDQTGQIYLTPTNVHVTMVVTLTLHPSDAYVFKTYVETETRAETDGPLGADTALGQAGFYGGPPPSAKLESITY